MEKLEIDAGVKAPKVSFDPDTGLLELLGRSIPENSYEVYRPMLQWVERYIQQPAPETRLDFKLIYFNSSSAEYLLELMKYLEQLHTQGKAVEIHWHYDAGDEDMQQVGEDFKAMLSIPILMVERVVETPENDDDMLEME